jgi:putative ABC transport system permease protein
MFRNVEMAFEAIDTNKLRGSLMMLGVVVGVMVTIILISMGQSAKQYIADQINSFGFGPNCLVIHPGDIDPPIEPSKLTFEDARRINAQVPGVIEAIPFIFGSREIRVRKKKHKLAIYGVNEHYSRLVNHPVAEGRFLSSVDVNGAKRVCLLGKTTKEELFGAFSPIGEEIVVEGHQLTIIGVMDRKGEMLGFDFDDIVIVPVTMAAKILETTKLLEIGVWIEDKKMIEVTKDNIRKLLVSRHFGKEDFHFHTQEQMVGQFDTIISALTYFVAAIAAISLFVGSIGIMNIMLAAVTERFREIGIRKAIGATNEDIFRQFFWEAVLISVTGGIIGLMLGELITVIVTYLLKFPFVLVWWAVALALSFSFLVGLAAGIYPAVKAAKLQPIDALRYE